jgi:pimeloyl-ACP methyl ester carboxylesterase
MDTAATADGVDSKFEHHTVSLDAVSMHYVIGGSGPPLVLVHGFPQHWRMWRKVMPALAEHFTVIAIDQRGMGGSSITPTGYDKTTLAGDLKHLLDKLAIAKLNLVGFDLGGGTAYAFASLWPEKMQRLAVIEYAPPGFGFEYGFQPTRDWQSWQLSFFTVPDVAVQFIAGKERELLAWYFWHWSYNPEAIDRADFEEYVRQLQKPGALRAGFAHFASVFDDTEQVQRFAARKLTMPVLALGGERGAADYVLGAMQRLADNATGGIVPKAGHWIADEQPAALASRLLDFFASRVTVV